MTGARGAEGERGSAPVESVFSILFVLFFALGVIQVALLLYARNVVMSAAHEGARAAVELGRETRDAEEIVVATVRRAAGGLVRELRVGTSVGGAGDPVVRVEVTATLRPIGPLPVALPVRAAATARRDVVVP